MSNHDHNHERGLCACIVEGFSRLAKAIDSLTREIKKKNKPKGRLDLIFGAPVKKEREIQMVNITITNEQKIPVTLNPKTDTGKPAKLDGAPVWSVTDGDATLVVAPDGLSADLVSGDLPGVSNILVDADADLGTGVEDLQEVITLTVTGANAKNLGITPGTAVAK